MKRTVCFALCLSLLFTLLAGCGPSLPQRTVVEAGTLQHTGPQAGDMVAEIITSKGAISVVLYPALAPIAVQNFLLLASQGFYEGTAFHRVVEGYFIQGGGEENASALGYTFGNEVSNQLYHFAGALCTANFSGQRNSNGSGFYIVAAPPGNLSGESLATLRQSGFSEAVVEAYAAAGGLPYLDTRDTVFGQVYAGMEVVDAIAATRADGENRPKTAITIESITVGEYG